MITIREAQNPSDIRYIRQLFQEYARGLDIDLCFQSFDQELATLPGAYVPPKGALLLAEDRDQKVGCIALRKIREDIGEVKRLYIVPKYRGLGIARRLIGTLIEQAKVLGFSRLRLDTLAEMKAAQHLYRSFGFQEIPPYYHNPIERAIYMELILERRLENTRR